MSILKLLFNFGETFINKLFTDPAEQQRAKAVLETMEHEGDLLQMESQIKAILAEANSSDHWTSRARPSFMYVMYLIILFALPMGILSAVSPETAHLMIKGAVLYLTSIPPNLYTLFEIAICGYIVKDGASLFVEKFRK